MRDTAERLFKHTGFTILWIVFIGIFIKFVSWPIRNAALVCWVYGNQAYFDKGIRVLKAKPIRFSNGELAPTFPVLATTFAAVFITVLGLTILLLLVVQLYERKKRNQADPEKLS
jgi:hypothetical protein